MANPRSPRTKPASPPRPGPDPLRELLTTAAADPATDPSVAEWLRRLLADGASEQVHTVRDTHSAEGRATS